MQSTIDYTSKKGLSFQIHIESIQNPAEADHWRYVFKCVDPKSLFKRDYQVMILKKLIPTIQQADIFVMGDPFEYLRFTCLDNYTDGSHDMFWPELSRGWAVF